MHPCAAQPPAIPRAQAVTESPRAAERPIASLRAVIDPA